MRPTLALPLPGTVRDPLYPDSDGRFMGDTDYHSVAMICLRQGLEDYFADRDDVYVGMNLILYYEQGQPNSRRDPDILVAKGVGKHRRRSFRVWEEKTCPSTLLEVVSASTIAVDLGEKRVLYERLRIPEYFLFDPEARYMKPPLRGFRLRRGKYEELKPAADGSLISKELDLRLVPEGELLRLIDLKTGKPVLTRQEQAERAKERVRIERRRTRQEQQRAEEEKQRAEEEKQRAEEEKRNAAALAAEVERLRALLKQHHINGGGR